jgi:hypothetical protein
MNEQNENIRIGDWTYSLPFLRELLDCVRDGHTDFATDMLRMWEDRERNKLREIQGISIDPEIEAIKQERIMEEKERKSDD